MTLGTIKLVAGFTVTAVASLAVGFYAGVRSAGVELRKRAEQGDLHMEIKNNDGGVDTYGTRLETSE